MNKPRKRTSDKKVDKKVSKKKMKRPSDLSPFPRSTYERNATIYKTLSNPKRLEILNTIKNRELTVGELVEVLQIRKANLSQHLTILRHHRLVKTRRDGKNIYYTIEDPRVVEPCRILHEFWGKKRNK